jgi:hypothetical protein
LFKVLKESALWQAFEVRGERLFPGAIILGDPGYPCNDWIITPFSDESTAGKRRFNKAQKCTRNAIERCFGVIKHRFHSLKTPIRFRKVENAAKLIVCACILHNMCLAIGDDVDDLTPGPPAPVFDDNDAADNGAVLRREQILRLFN